jgi:hypothetical protein
LIESLIRRAMREAPRSIGPKDLGVASITARIAIETPKGRADTPDPPKG